MDDYVPKPVRLEDLDAALRRWLPGSGAEPTHEGAPVDPTVRARLQQLERPGREGELTMLIGMFVEDTTDRLRLLHEAAARQDAGALREVAHALRGAAGHFGLTELVQGCEHVESLACAGALSRAPEVVADLASAFCRAQDTLKTASAARIGTGVVDLVESRA